MNPGLTSALTLLTPAQYVRCQSLCRCPPHEHNRAKWSRWAEGHKWPRDNTWSSPAILIHKKGYFQFCPANCFLVPRTCGALDMLTEAKWFSTRDLGKTGKLPCTIVTIRIQHSLLVRDYGSSQLCPLASAMLLWLTDCIPRGLTYEACLVYLDDPVIAAQCLSLIWRQELALTN
jgi:hypothetical protein